MRSWAVRLEVSLYAALLRWILRRPAVPPGATAVGYGQPVAPMMGLWIFASALDVPLVHVLTPWEPVRIFLLVVNVWGLVWMVGMYAASRTHPHLLDEQGMRLRYARCTRCACRGGSSGRSTSSVSFWVDEPRSFVRESRERLEKVTPPRRP